MLLPVNLSQRRLQREVMDLPDLQQQRRVAALRGLGRLNRWSCAERILWQPVAEYARALPRPLRLLDLATGGGDLPVALWRRAQRSGVRLALAGCDVQATHVRYAQDYALASGADVHFFQLDVLADDLPSGYDVVTCSLFLHHLSQEEALRLLAKMARATEGLVLVNDLRRSVAGFALAAAASRLLTSSDVVHHDALRSVEAAFTVEEVRRLASAARLDGATVERYWPCRFLLAWRRRT